MSGTDACFEAKKLQDMLAAWRRILRSMAFKYPPPSSPPCTNETLKGEICFVLFAVDAGREALTRVKHIGLKAQE